MKQPFVRFSVAAVSFRHTSPTDSGISCRHGDRSGPPLLGAVEPVLAVGRQRHAQPDRHVVRQVVRE
ncbi:MAG TPA: hypothetical protein VK862_16550, partial [Afifellaceae bacterium]|nr:hypothetical protein [Afifellaceae bacterium]